MMKIEIIIVGKTKRGPLREMEEEYMKRLRGFAEVKIIAVRESSVGDSSNQKARKAAVRKEEVEILGVIPEGGFCVVMDERGKSLTSPELAGLIQKKRDFESGRISFVIGGPFGLGENVRKRADMVLSLSSFTFTHEMARVILLEQIYRAFAILSGKVYHY